MKWSTVRPMLCDAVSERACRSTLVAMLTIAPRPYPLFSAPGHIFHGGCIREWFANRRIYGAIATCPQCKKVAFSESEVCRLYPDEPADIDAQTGKKGTAASSVATEDQEVQTLRSQLKRKIDALDLEQAVQRAQFKRKIDVLVLDKHQFAVEFKNKTEEIQRERADLAEERWLMVGEREGLRTDEDDLRRRKKLLAEQKARAMQLAEEAKALAQTTRNQYERHLIEKRLKCECAICQKRPPIKTPSCKCSICRRGEAGMKAKHSWEESQRMLEAMEQRIRSVEKRMHKAEADLLAAKLGISPNAKLSPPVKITTPAITDQGSSRDRLATDERDDRDGNVPDVEEV